MENYNFKGEINGKTYNSLNEYKAALKDMIDNQEEIKSVSTQFNYNSEDHMCKECNCESTCENCKKNKEDEDLTLFPYFTNRDGEEYYLRALTKDNSKTLKDTFNEINNQFEKSIEGIKSIGDESTKDELIGYITRLQKIKDTIGSDRLSSNKLENEARTNIVNAQKEIEEWNKQINDCYKFGRIAFHMNNKYDELIEAAEEVLDQKIKKTNKETAEEVKTDVKETKKQAEYSLADLIGNILSDIF